MKTCKHTTRAVCTNYSCIQKLLLLFFNSHLRAFFSLLLQRKGESKRERSIAWLPPLHAQTGDRIDCSLTRDCTRRRPDWGPNLQPFGDRVMPQARHTSQGKKFWFPLLSHRSPPHYSVSSMRTGPFVLLIPVSPEFSQYWINTCSWSSLDPSIFAPEIPPFSSSPSILNRVK